MTVCVQKADGAQTAQCPASVRTERPALQMKGSVSVLQDTEATAVSGVSPTSAPHHHLQTKKIRVQVEFVPIAYSTTDHHQKRISLSHGAYQHSVKISE